MDVRVGVLGGTFDPVHNGHLIIAEEAQAKLGLSKVLFIPAGRPWFKDGENVSDMEWRLDMLRLAVEGNPSFSIDTQELERPGASYTVDTIEQLAARMGGDVQLYFIIGLDALAELGRWKEPRRLVSICHFATMRRPGYTDLDIAALDRDVPESPTGSTCWTMSRWTSAHRGFASALRKGFRSGTWCPRQSGVTSRRKGSTRSRAVRYPGFGRSWRGSG